ncbi:MAG: hypothetical protein C0508_05935 [Cyanobacteria bacterium PR.023]|jgi:hypothetical protein|nr:hypothetical protein [Cyanobacteria bacterium PR.023]
MTKFTPSPGQQMKMTKLGALWPLIARSITCFGAGISLWQIGPSQASECFPATSSNSSCSSATYKYEGNLISRKFHQPNCPYSLVMAHSRKIMLESKKQAVAEGYKPCRFCLATVTRTVEAKLINLDISR